MDGIAHCWLVYRDEGPEAAAKYHKEHCMSQQKVWDLYIADCFRRVRETYRRMECQDPS